ncbi:MAG: hypothetical protein ACREUL_07500 [Steroidobacteraceae bacterium]
MTQPQLGTASVPSAPPREVRIAIYLQAIFFLRALVTGVAAYAFFGETRGYPVAAALILLFLAGIWSLWICGLWWRRNWVGWLTVILNIVAVCNALRSDIAHDRVPNILSCFLVAALVGVTIILLRPVAHDWYRRRPASRLQVRRS